MIKEDLIKTKWNNQDKKDFLSFLDNQKIESKIEWTRRILNTNYPILAIPTPTLKDIAKEILKGDYLSFLDLHIYDNYESIAINGFIISIIKDFDTMKKYLLDFSKIVDNWANCDMLKFKIKDKNKMFELSKELISSPLTFERRIGIIIWFDLIQTEHFEQIISLIPNFKTEKEYYVNMALAWFIAECFIKRKSDTIKLYESKNLNDFVINKSIQKCRDSFRVSNEDKNALLKYKTNNKN